MKFFRSLLCLNSSKKLYILKLIFYIVILKYLYKTGLITKFDVGYRTKKKEASIVIPKSAIKVDGKKIIIYSNKFQMPQLLRLFGLIGIYLKKLAQI